MKRLRELGDDAPHELKPLVDLVAASQPMRQGHRRRDALNPAVDLQRSRRTRRRWVLVAAVAMAFAAAASVNLAVEHYTRSASTVRTAAPVTAPVPASPEVAPALPEPVEPAHVAASPVETPARPRPLPAVERSVTARAVAAQSTAEEDSVINAGSAELAAPTVATRDGSTTPALAAAAPGVLATTPPPADTGDELLIDGLRALHREHRPAVARALASEYLARFADGPLANEAWALLVDAATAGADPDVDELTAQYRARFPTGRGAHP